ncbi:dephospho-CoA kinase [Ascidiimonas sp. W6]|uniref:dephospho-CoA kinase n=1 Tax=Ascidiimonas meishanensis TaxID=3128903 RepID=UPI0030EF3559
MIIGLTGGIGSGKSTVAKMFQELGVPIYVADIEAKKLLVASSKVKNQVINLLGKKAYKGQEPDRAFISSLVFKDAEKLQELNNIIHPAVKIHFMNWYKNQDAVYVIKEAAILFESGSHKDCDFIITVTAPEKVRIKRVMQRDSIDENTIRERMQHQWSDKQKIERSDYVIYNSSLEKTQEQVLEIHHELLNKST